MKNTIEPDLIVITTTMHIEEAIRKYLEWKWTYCIKAPTTYVRTLQRFVEIIDAPFETLNNEHVVKFQQKMQDIYHPNTYSQHIIIIKNFFKFWRGRGKTQVNVDEIRTPRKVKADAIYVTEEEHYRLVGACSDEKFADLTKKLVLCMLWDTGVRVSELCSLDISQLNLEERTTQMFTRKSYRKRWIKWSEGTNALLKRYLGVRLCLNSRQALFISYQHRERLTPRTIQRWVKELAHVAGLTKLVTPHKYRHGKGHKMKGEKADIPDIALILGHENWHSSEVYVRADKKEFLEVANRYL